MKTSNIFWDVVANYNEATWWAQAILFILGVVLVIVTFVHPNKRNQVFLKVYLAFCFGWLAIAFFWLNDPSPIGRYFGSPLFTLIALLFAWDLRANRIRFHFPDSFSDRVSLYVGLIVFLLYPLVSLALGHVFPSMVTFVMPCPFTVLGITLLLSSFPEADSKMMILLLLWAVAGIPKMFGLFDVREDTLLVFVGLGGAWIWWRKRFSKVTGIQNIG